MNVPLPRFTFIDVINDGNHENGEPIASWSGTLTKNVFNTTWFFWMPNLHLSWRNDSVVMERGETFRIGCKSQ